MAGTGVTRVVLERMISKTLRGANEPMMLKKPIVLAAIALAALTSASAQGPEAMQGKKVPAFSMKDIKGKTHTAQSLKGKVVVLDFWATWCGPCKQASPTMQKLHQKYAKQGLVVIGANVSDAPGAAAKYAKEHKYTYNFTTGGDSLGQKLGVQGIPAFFFIDRQGVIQRVQTGFAPGLEADFEATVKKLLAKK